MLTANSQTTVLKSKLTDKKVIQNPDIKILDKIIDSPQVIIPNPDIDYAVSVDMQIGFLARKVKSDPSLTLGQRAKLVRKLKDMQLEEGIFPYDRFIKCASNNRGKILSRSESATDKDQTHIIWGTNHYLGLNRNKEVIEYSKQCMDEYGVGSGTSVLSGGMNNLHRQIEMFFSSFWNKEESIMFPTGFTTNVGVLSSIAGPGDMIIFDHECHASIIEGVKLSRAEYMSFRHNSMEDLEKKIAKFSKQYKNIIVAVETVYSMSGDVTPIKTVADLKDKYPFTLYVDEAHSFGFYGENGRGLCHQEGCLDKVDLIMTTLSKSTGSLGGIVSCNRELAAYIQYQANSYIFQASVSPADAAAVIKALEILSTDDSYSKKLWENTKYFRKLLLAAGFDLRDSKSPIVPIYIRDPLTLAQLCKDIFKKGIFTNWISYPVVKITEGRLRFITTANHTTKDIEETVKILRESYGQITNQ